MGYGKVYALCVVCCVSVRVELRSAGCCCPVVTGAAVSSGAVWFIEYSVFEVRNVILMAKQSSRKPEIMD